MAADLPVEVQLAAAKQHLVRTKLRIMEHRGDRTTLRAPVDGVVVAGDLRKAIGSVVPLGEPLFAIAQLEQWTLELGVPESRAASMRAYWPG